MEQSWAPIKKSVWKLLQEDQLAPQLAQAQTEATMPEQPDVTAEDIENDSYIKKMGGGLSLSRSSSSSAPSMSDIQKEIYSKLSQSMEGQRGNIETLKKRLQEELEDPRNQSGLSQLDLRPFAQALKQYGSQTAVVPTAGPEDRSEMKRKLQDAVTRAQQGLTDDEVNFLRTQLQDKKEAADAARQNRFQTGLDTKLYQALQKETNKASEIVLDAHQALKNVESALAPDEKNTVSVARVRMALSNFARLMGEKGVLTDQDTGRQLAPNAILKMAQVENWVSKNPNEVRVPAEVVSAMSEALADARTALGEAAKLRVQNIKESYGEPTAPTAEMFYTRGGAKMVDKLEKRLTPIFGSSTSANAKGPAAPGMPSQDAIKAELERRMKK